jgi:hypothetical protein
VIGEVRFEARFDHLIFDLFWSISNLVATVVVMFGLICCYLRGEFHLDHTISLHCVMRCSEHRFASICGLVVEYTVVIGVTRVRVPVAESSIIVVT